MTLQQSGPYCDVCGNPITGIDGGMMEHWSMPGGLTLLACNPRCSNGFAQLKAAACQAFAADALTWLHWLMDGRKATWDEISKSISDSVVEAMTEFHKCNGRAIENAREAVLAT